MNAPRLTFGTDGWRGAIARDATFETYRRLARAAAGAYRDGEFGPGDTGRVVIGHDPRFLSEEFSRVVASEFALAGIEPIVTDRPIPTPAVSLHVRRLGLSGGIAVTASHNPATDNGFKLKASFGGSAPPELYSSVERRIDRELPAAAGGALPIRSEDLTREYREALGLRVDREAIARAGLHVLSDAMHGAAADGLESIVGKGRTRIESFRSERNVLFGDGHPEPIARNLTGAAERLSGGGYDLAVATDGDADRLGVLDAHGRFVNSHRVLALLVLHAFRHRGLSGGIAKTFSTSLLIDRIAERLGAPLHETAIGFKYVADLMISGRAVVGGEESGGYGFAFHLPERDGTLSALLLLEHLALSGRSLDQALSALDDEFGRFEYSRRDVSLPTRPIAEFLASIEARPPKSIAGRAVTGCRALDGVKLSFADRGWLLLRRSGTEPMIRLYCEHEDGDACHAILGRAEQRLREFVDKRS